MKLTYMKKMPGIGKENLNTTEVLGGHSKKESTRRGRGAQFCSCSDEILFSSSQTKLAGFTLIELILSFTILAIIGTVGTIYFLNLRDRKVLDITAEEIVFALRDAQQKSISQASNPVGQLNDWGWGVCFNNTTTSDAFYALYSNLCTLPGGGEEISRYYLNQSVVFISPSSITKSQISFSKGTGMRFNSILTTSSVTIALTRDNTISRTIIVNDAGVISY